MKFAVSTLIGSILCFLSAEVSARFEADAERNAKIVIRNSTTQSIDTARNGSAPGDASPLYATRFKGVTWDPANWRLTTTELDQGHYQSRGSIANGYLGINVASAGPFFELDDPVSGDVINGWPVFSRRQTFATIAGFYSFQKSINASNFPWLNGYGGDLISGVPHWSGLILDLGDGNYLDASVKNSTVSNFKSTQDMKRGILSWQYTWSPERHNKTYDIFYQLIAHKLHVNQALVHMEITPSRDGNVSVINAIDGYSAVRTEFKDSGLDGGAIYTAVNPEGISNVTAFIYAELSGTEGVDLRSSTLVSNKPYLHSNGSTIAQSVNVRLRAGMTTKIDKFVGAASSDGFVDPRLAAKKASKTALQTGYEASLRTHIAEWATGFPSDSVDDFSIPGSKWLPLDHHIVEASIVSVANPYYLLQSTVSSNALAAVNNAPLNRESIAVGGLTSDSYGGLVFWDADIWMQPGLVVSFPEASRIFSNYRADMYDQAMKNVRTQFTSSKNRTHFSRDAAAYPWTSGRFGNCTATGPCFDYQYHLNGDIGLQLVNELVTTGDVDNFKSNLFPIYNSIATFFADLMEKNGTKWTVTNMTDPDEFANSIDGGGYTMALIASTLINANTFRRRFGLEPNQTWDEMARNVLISRDSASQVTLEYTTMNGSTHVKQADIVLNTFPLRYTEDYTHQNALQDLDYYAAKQSPNGPAMTYAIFSIVANEVSPSGCSAYTYGQYSFSPYVRAPFFQFSEQVIDDWTLNEGTHPAYPFLTGNGGANQVAIFGYLGLRLEPDGVLYLNPNLPPQIPHIKYRIFYWHGWPIEAYANYSQTVVQRAANRRPLTTADQKFANASIPVHVGPESHVTIYSLPLSGQLVIPNRQIASINTLANNLVQCQPVFSPNEFIPGQFPISAVDGAASTKWQPLRARSTSWLTVTLPSDASASSAAISGFAFDWAQAPPVNAKIVLHDEPINPQLDLDDAFSGRNPVGTVTIWETSSIPMSDPYNPKTVDLNMIMTYKGNTTNVTLPSPVPVTKFATLLIKGNQALGSAEVKAGNGTGATVAEWSILRNV